MADVAQLKVLNAALAALGNEPLTDLTDDSIQQSGAAYKLLRSIELSFDAVIGRHGWTCALEYVQLTPLAAPAGDWKYPWRYTPPGDCLLVWEIEGQLFNGDAQCWAPRWQVGTVDTDIGARQIIRSRDSIDTLNVAYVRRCSYGALTPHLVDAIGHELAGRCCFSINGDAGTAERLKNTAEKKILMAISVEGTQEGGQQPIAPSIPQMIRNRSR